MSPLLVYIDPGSGSLLWQVALAGALGLFFQLRHSVRAFGRRALTRLARKGPTPRAVDGE